MQNITVSVTQSNIDNGCSHSCSSCPVALALRDLGDKYSYLVNCAALYNIHHERVAVLPCDAVRFIQDFDLGRPVKPFTFNVSF
jgi:hypothetical protein